MKRRTLRLANLHQKLKSERGFLKLLVKQKDCKPILKAASASQTVLIRSLITAFLSKDIPLPIKFFRKLEKSEKLRYIKKNFYSATFSTENLVKKLCRISKEIPYFVKPLFLK